MTSQQYRANVNAVGNPFGRTFARYGSNATPNLSFFQGNISREPHKTFGDYLSQTSMTLLMGLNLLLFVSPWVAKSPAVAQFAKNALVRQGKSLSPKAKVILEQISNPKKLKELLQRFISFAYLFQLNTGWQVGIHTQQPSKLLTSITGAIRESLQIMKPAGYLQAGSYLSNFLWYAGETNDINNNNHPAQRREWDPKRLVRLLFGQSAENGATWGSELSSLCQYVMQDYRHALSLKPWKELVHSLRNETNWHTPQSYQTALGAQFNMAAFIGSIATLVAESKLKNIPVQKLSEAASKIPLRLRTFTRVMAACSVVSYAPIVMRALQDWKTKEGVLTLLGVPLTTTYQVLLASREISTNKGFFALGAPMINEGKRLNGKKYRAQVNYLQFLHRLSVQNPQLTAVDILRFLYTNPDELKAMELHMGKVRVNYILDMLKAGARRQQTGQLSLAVYLASIMQKETP
jgi:hypothetical protein